MTTYLQGVKDLRQETTDSGTGPSTVASQTGELGRLCKWYKDAWTSLQQEKDDWLWMRKSFIVSTTESDGEYAYTDCNDTVTETAIARFAFWYKHAFKCYLTSGGVGGEYPLIWMPWEAFRRRYRYGTQNDGPPCHVSVDPLQQFCLGPKPNGIYVVGGDYQLGPQILAADDDAPEMPSRFHDLIMFHAMLKYGGSRVAPEAMLRAATEAAPLRAALTRDQRPSIGLGGSIA